MPIKPPETVTGTRGELVEMTGRSGHTLVWLWPRPAPVAQESAQVLLDPERLAAVTLRPGQSLALRRAAVDQPALSAVQGGFEIFVSSGEGFCDVSRTPTRFSLEQNGELVVDTDMSGRVTFAN